MVCPISVLQKITQCILLNIPVYYRFGIRMIDKDLSTFHGLSTEYLRTIHGYGVGLITCFAPF